MPIESKTILMFRSEIKISPDRLRDETDKMHANSLAESIAQHDLLHAPVVDKENWQLIAGAHRIAAWDINQFLERPCPNPEYENWLRIPVRFAYNVTPQELMALELTENIQSKSMNWKEIARGVSRIHGFANMDSEQTRGETAKLLNMTLQAVSNNLRAAHYLIEGEELVLAATSLTGAMNVIQRIEERKFDDLKESLRSGMSIEEAITDQSPKPVDDWELDLEDGDTAQPSGEKPTSDFRQQSAFQAVNADFLEWVTEYAGPRFNLIHCDFPYGIDYNKSGFDYAKHHSIYGDSKDLYFALLSALCGNVDKLATDSCHLIFWYNTRYRSETVSMLEAAGFKVWPHHLIWAKSDNAGVLADPKRGPRHTHETAIFATRGDRKLVKPVADTFTSPTTRDSGHVSEKPLAVLDHFFNLVVDESTRVLDPTAGSFNSLLAAQKRGARSGVGVELESSYAARGKRVLGDAG